MSDFDPMRSVRFRGKRLSDLTHAETLEALVQALRAVNHMEDTRPPRVWPTHVQEAEEIKPRPLPPRHDLSWD